MKKLILTLFVTLIWTQFASATEVAFERDPSLPLVYLNLAIKAGSVTDPKGKSGLTNFLGEMLLRGTHSRNKEQIDLALDQIGARLEIEVRAEALILRGAVLSSQLQPFLDLVQEIVTTPSFPEREITRLKSEMISGILEERGSDSALVGRAFNEFLFHGHPYGNPVIGKEKDIASFNQNEISTHYDQLFQDPLILIVGSGDADESVIKNWAQAIAKARPSKGSTDFAKVGVPEDSKTRRLLIVDKPDRTQTQIDAGQIGVRMTDPDFFALYLGNYAFGGGSFSARLMDEIRVKRGWSYGAGSYFREGLKPRSWQIHLFPAEKDTAAATKLTLQMVSELKDKGITLPEYTFSQESLVNGAGFMFDTPRKRVENKLLERTLDLPDGFMKTYGPKIKEVKLEEVNAALKHFLKPDALAVTVVGTAKNLKKPLADAVGIPESQVEIVPYSEE